jgi:hypothetical protein
MSTVITKLKQLLLDTKGKGHYILVWIFVRKANHDVLEYYMYCNAGSSVKSWLSICQLIWGGVPCSEKAGRKRAETKAAYSSSESALGPFRKRPGKPALLHK